MFRIGIIGAGWIARKMARGIAPLKDVEVYAISSRSLEKPAHLRRNMIYLWHTAAMRK